MAEPLQEQLLTSVETALGEIDGEAPYFWRARTVKFADIGPSDLADGPFPLVYVGGITSAPIGDSSAAADTYVMERMDVEIVGHVGATTNPRLDLRRLEHDIRTALWADPTRDGLAILSWWEGTSITAPTGQPALSLVAVRFAFQYEVKLSDLTSTIP